jgi:hypothetical protein
LADDDDDDNDDVFENEFVLFRMFPNGNSSGHWRILNRRSGHVKLCTMPSIYLSNKLRVSHLGMCKAAIGKVKFALERSSKAQRRSKVIAALFV